MVSQNQPISRLRNGRKIKIKIACVYSTTTYSWTAIYDTFFTSVGGLKPTSQSHTGCICDMWCLSATDGVCYLLPRSLLALTRVPRYRVLQAIRHWRSVTHRTDAAKDRRSVHSNDLSTRGLSLIKDCPYDGPLHHSITAGAAKKHKPAPRGKQASNLYPTVGTTYLAY